MKNDWASATNLERIYDLVLAITTLSLYYKTIREDRTIEHFTNEEIELAKNKITKFLEQFKQILENTETNPDRIVTGTNPRFGEIVMRYRARRRLNGARNDFYNVSFDYIIELLRSSPDKSFGEVIIYLHELRSLIDETTVIDINNLLGEL